jgi:ribosomal-protein-alanine N-acetyltransferase
MPIAVITPARDVTTDCEAIVAIDKACFAQSTVNVSAELERPWSHVWVARLEDDESEPRAFMLSWVVADELHILSVATQPGFRRQGLGSALLDYAMEFARIRKLRSVLLEVRRSNLAAIALYRRYGFSAIGIRPRYYADNFEDAIEMMLNLDPVTGKILPGDDEVGL